MRRGKLCSLEMFKQLNAAEMENLFAGSRLASKRNKVEDYHKQSINKTPEAWIVPTPEPSQLIYSWNRGIKNNNEATIRTNFPLNSIKVFVIAPETSLITHGTWFSLLALKNRKCLWSE